jgi:hypothetical protein
MNLVYSLKVILQIPQMEAMEELSRFHRLYISLHFQLHT